MFASSLVDEIETRLWVRAWARLCALGWTKWFLILGSVSGLALVLTIGPLSGVDESSHVARLDTIVQGTYIAPPSGENPNSYHIDSALCERFVAGSIFVSGCRPTARARGSSFMAILASEGYPPIAYLAAWPGYRLGRAAGGIDPSITGARLSQLACYLAVVALALRLAPRGHALIFTVALLPSSIEGASTVSADPITLSFSLLAVAIALRLASTGEHGQRASNRGLLALAGCLMVVSAAKPGYGSLALIAFVLPTATFGSWRRRLGFGFATIGACAILAVGWYAVALSKLTDPVRYNTDPTAQATWVANNPVAFLKSIIRTWTDIDEMRMILSGVVAPVSRLGGPEVPGVVLVGVLAALLVAAIGGKVPRRSPVDGGTTALGRIDLLAFAAVATAVAVVFMAVNYAMFTGNTPVGASMVTGIQGRYFLPLMPLLLFVGPRPPRGLGSRDFSMIWPGLLALLAIWWILERS